jgi:hypothetical protein
MDGLGAGVMALLDGKLRTELALVVCLQPYRNDQVS